MTDRGPLPRSKPVALWTGTEMIAYGGYYQISGRVAERYNPATDSWSAMADSPTVFGPGVRAVWTGTEMIIHGGEIAGTDASQCNRYNPNTNTWTVAVRAIRSSKPPGPHRGRCAPG